MRHAGSFDSLHWYEMNEEALLRRRARIHAIVEGALLGDITIVFLLMRVYLPVLIVRTLIRAIACVPFVMLTQRRGVKMTILAAIASYVLFSALVGPILALTALDVAVAGILIGVGRKVGLGAGLNTLWTGPVYAILDLVIPTIVSIIIFRYPIKALVGSAHNFVKLTFNAVTGILQHLNAPASVVREVNGWEGPVATHWQFAYLGTSILYGLLTMYLAVLVSEMVLRQIPEQTLESQKAAA